MNVFLRQTYLKYFPLQNIVQEIAGLEYENVTNFLSSARIFMEDFFVMLVFCHGL